MSEFYLIFAKTSFIYKTIDSYYIQNWTRNMDEK